MLQSRPLLYLLLFSVLITILAAISFPITLDEAYYSLWGKNLAFGYFDHPPGIAFLTAILPNPHLHYLGPRLGTVIVGIGSLLLAVRLFYAIGLSSWQVLLTATLLFKFNLGGLSSGILATPDALLIFFWILALHEAFYALKGKKERWLTAGLASGCGLLSKYAMILIGPVFLIALWKDPRRSLRTPWPYLGGVLAFLIFLPNIYWNATHDWPSFAFQLRRLSQTELATQTDLAVPELNSSQGPEWNLAAKTIAQDELVKNIPAPRQTQQSKLYDTAIRILEFAGGLLVLWGFQLIPLSHLLRRRKKSKKEATVDIEPTAKPLFYSALLVPPIFFGFISLFTKVEANWAAIYMIAAAPLLARKLENSRKLIFTSSALNAFAVCLVACYGAKPLLPSHSDRILKESFGFESLAQHISQLPEPLFADKYQIVSMLRFYLPQKQILQWPGINRPSEFTHNPIYSFPYSKLKEKKEFWLITSELIPPHFADFRASYMEFIKDCKDGLKIQTSEKSSATDPCLSPHQWSIVHYVIP